MKKFSKKVLALLLSITMIFTTMMPATISAEAGTSLGNATLAGAITGGLKGIPFVGSGLSGLLGPVIGKACGIKTISDVLKQLDQISAQLDELSNKVDKLSVEIDKNHQETLAQMYKNDLNTFNGYMTDVQDGTISIYDTISSVSDSVTASVKNNKIDENMAIKLQMIKVACIVNSTTFSFSDYWKDVTRAKSYVAGTSFGAGDNALTRIYKAYCSDSILGGEAAIKAKDTVTSISDCMMNAYLASDIVIAACIYVNENYNEYADLVKNDPNFTPYASKLSSFSNGDEFASIAGAIERDCIKLFSEKAVIYTKDDNEAENEDENLVIGKPIEGGVIGEYNTMTSENWFGYITKKDYVSIPAQITYMQIDPELNFIIASDYGTTRRWDDKSSKKQTGTIESHTRFSAALRTAPNRALSRDELKLLFDHIQNSDCFGTGDTNNVTLEQALKNFGFSFNNYEQYLKDNNKTLPDSTRRTFLTKVDCNVEKHYDELTAYGPQLSDDVNTAYADFDKTFRIDTNYTNGKLDYMSIQLDGNSTDDFVAFYFTAAQTIDNEREFKDFYTKVANGDSYRNKTIRLTSDLDLSKLNLLTIWTDAKKENRFCGVFDGNGHTIKNIDMSSCTEWAGLFRSMGIDGEVKNLTIENSKFGNGKGIAVGGVVGQATGDNSVIDNVTVKNCIIKGTDYVGGIVGTSSLKEDDYCDDMYAMIRIRNCVSDSTITGTANTGGIEGGGGSVRIENCTNKSTVSSSGVAGGIYGQGLDRDEDPQIVVSDCTNEGDITSTGTYAGGIIGLIYSDSWDHYIYNNNNSGEINAKNIAGGIVAVSYGGGTYNDNKNSGNVKSESGNAAGVVAWIQDDGGSYCNNENSGEISGYYTSGGIGGYAGNSDKDRAYNVQNNKNTGNVEVKNGCAGGIFGDIHTDNTGHTVKNNSNTGNISANSTAGGIIGYNVGGGVTSGNTNEGVINSSDDNAGGIVGKIEDDATEIAKNYNYNKVTGKNQTGGIVGYIGSKSEDDKFNIHDNMNCGDIESTTSHAGGIIGHLCTDADHTVNNNINQYANVKGFWTAGGIVGRQDGGGMFDGNKIYKISIVCSSDAGGIVGYITDDKCEFKNSSIEKEIPSPSSTSWLDKMKFGFKSNTMTYDESKIDKSEIIDVKIEGKKRSGKIVGYDDYRDKTLDSDTLAGSIFGQGNIVIILTMLAIIIVAGATIIIVYKKKRNNIVAQ